jgi:hypothetical protein
MKITDKMAAQAELIVQAHREGREVLERESGSNGALKEVMCDFIHLSPRHDYTYELATKEPAVCWRNEYRYADGSVGFGSPHPALDVAKRQIDQFYCTYLRTVKFVEASE